MLLNNVAPDCWLIVGPVVTEAYRPAGALLSWGFSEALQLRKGTGSVC